MKTSVALFIIVAVLSGKSSCSDDKFYNVPNAPPKREKSFLNNIFGNKNNAKNHVKTPTEPLVISETIKSERIFSLAPLNDAERRLCIEAISKLELPNVKTVGQLVTELAEQYATSLYNSYINKLPIFRPRKPYGLNETQVVVLPFLILFNFENLTVDIVDQISHTILKILRQNSQASLDDFHFAILPIKAALRQIEAKEQPEISQDIKDSWENAMKGFKAKVKKASLGEVLLV